ARPDRGRLAAEADAVLFEDEAELIACLLLSLAWEPAAPWWRSAVARWLPASPLPLLRAEILPLFPAVVRRLTAWREEAQLARLLSADEILQVITGLVSLARLPSSLAACARAAADEGREDRPPAPGRTDHGAASDQDSVPSSEPPAAPSPAASSSAVPSPD